MGGVLKNSFSRWVQIMPDLYLKHSWLAFWTPAVLLHLYVCDSFLTTGQLGHCGRHCTTTKTNIFAVRLPSPPQHFGDSVSCIPGSSLYSQVLGLQPLHKQGWESNWRLNKRARQTLSPLSYNPSSPSTLCSLSYKMPAISWFVERRVWQIWGSFMWKHYVQNKNNPQRTVMIWITTKSFRAWVVWWLSRSRFPSPTLMTWVRFPGPLCDSSDLYTSIEVQGSPPT